MAEEFVSQPPRQANKQLRYEAVLLPTSGISDGSPYTMDPSSLQSSSQNMWVSYGELRPRARLNELTSGATITASLAITNSGGMIYYGSDGTNYPVFFDGTRLSWLSNSGSDWTHRSRFTYNITGSWYGVFGITSYLTRLDRNILIFSASTNNPLQVWAGPRSTPTGSADSFSLLTGAPNAMDIAGFDYRVVAWHVASSGITAPTRVQWSTAGNPEDWTGYGSGYEDLLTMRGVGTRVFAQEDQLVLASTQELWRGRAIGLPYVFQFTPITQTVGIPWPRAAVQTPWGIFWLGADLMVRVLVGEQILEIGHAIQRDLQSGFVAWRAPGYLMTFNADTRTVSLWINETAAAGFDGNRLGFTYHINDRAWVRFTSPFSVTNAACFLIPQTPADSAVNVSP